MAGKLDKIGADLEKARAKRDEWDAKVKDLEQKYREAENTMIHEMVHAANLTPERLAKIIQMAATQAPGTFPDISENQNEEDYGYEN